MILLSEKLIFMVVHGTCLNVSRYKLDSCCLTVRVLDIRPKQKQIERIQLRTRYETNGECYRCADVRSSPKESGKHARDAPVVDANRRIFIS